MDASAVFRLISLIPDRAPRTQSGARFAVEGRSDRVVLLAKFLHWLGPLDPISKEDQQLLGVRAGGGKPLEEGAEEPLSDEHDSAVDEQALQQPGAGTQIAA